MDDTHAYILMNCKGGESVSAPGVGGNMPLVTVDLGRWPKSVKCSPHLRVAAQHDLVMFGDFLPLKKMRNLVSDLNKDGSF